MSAVKLIRLLSRPRRAVKHRGVHEIWVAARDSHMSAGCFAVSSIDAAPTRRIPSLKQAASEGNARARVTQTFCGGDDFRPLPYFQGQYFSQSSSCIAHNDFACAAYGPKDREGSRQMALNNLDAVNDFSGPLYTGYFAMARTAFQICSQIQVTHEPGKLHA